MTNTTIQISEIQQGLEKRLLRGQWTSLPPIGYLMKDGLVVLDPARAPRIREAFELWAQDSYTAEKLSEEMYSRGLVGRRGKKLGTSALCRLLKNPFYIGEMVINGQKYGSPAFVVGS